MAETAEALPNNEPTEFKSEARFSFFESTGVIVGHGVGAGI